MPERWRKSLQSRCELRKITYLQIHNHITIIGSQRASVEVCRNPSYNGKMNTTLRERPQNLEKIIFHF